MFAVDEAPISRVRAQRLAALLLAFGAIALFTFFGNSARGYIHSRSLFFWWASQWFDPGADADWGPLILCVSAALFFLNWNQSFARRASDRPSAGAWWCALALLLHLAGYAMEQTRVSIFALLLFVYGTLEVGGFSRAARASRFPLFFAALAIPFGFLDPLSFSLRLGVSETTERIFRACGHPILRNGTQLFSANGGYQYDVAAACSGIRSLTALVGLTLLLGYLRLSRGWTRALLVALTLPFAFLGNLLRIVAIIAAAQWHGESAGALVHAWSGWVVFAVVLGLALLLVRVFARWEHPSHTTHSTAQMVSAPHLSTVSVPLATFCALLFVIWACHEIDLRRGVSAAGLKLAENGIDPAPLPEFITTEWIGQRVDVSKVEREVLPPDTGYSRRNYVSVADREHQVFVSFVLSGRDRTSIHRPELCLVGQGWTVVDRRRSEIAVGDGVLPVSWLRVQRVVTSPGEEPRTLRAIFAYAFIGPTSVTPSHATMVWESSFDRLTRLRADRWAYLVLQTWDDADEHAIAQRLGEVFQPVWEAVGAAPELLRKKG